MQKTAQTKAYSLKCFRWLLCKMKMGHGTGVIEQQKYPNMLSEIQFLSLLLSPLHASLCKSGLVETEEMLFLIKEWLSNYPFILFHYLINNGENIYIIGQGRGRKNRDAKRRVQIDSTRREPPGTLL